MESRIVAAQVGNVVFASVYVPNGGKDELRVFNQFLLDMQRNPGVAPQAVPEDVVVRKLALLRDLRRLGLQLLQAENVRPLRLQPLAELRRAGADAVDIPGGDFQNFRSP
jgi:hypothetical protein